MQFFRVVGKIFGKKDSVAEIYNVEEIHNQITTETTTAIWKMFENVWRKSDYKLETLQLKISIHAEVTEQFSYCM